MSESSFAPTENIESATHNLIQSKKVVKGSSLAFLLSHNGYRPNALHLVLGLSGGGKSTLFRTMVLDRFKNNNSKKNIGIWYSEESQKDFGIHFVKTELADAFFKDRKVNFFSEMDSWKNKKHGSEKFDALCKISDIVFFDNITTSKLYGNGFSDEKDCVFFLKKMALRHNIPIVVFAHTGANIREGGSALIEQNDIRGSKEIVNQSSFIYIIQQLHTDSNIFSTLRIVKARGQDVDTKLFLLQYSKKTSTYEKNEALSFSIFKEIFKERNKL